MKPISNGFATATTKIDIESRIDAILTAKMCFFVRSPLSNATVSFMEGHFPDLAMLMPLPQELLGKPWPWELIDDPFLDVSAMVEAARASYLAPGIHFNHYLDWLLFDIECEQGLHPVDVNEARPSNIVRRTHFEVFAHSVLIALKSGLDRLASLVGHYVAGVASHMTWGRIEEGKPSGFMSVVERGRNSDELLEFLHHEYVAWISDMVAPRDEIIHYADLQSSWQFLGWPVNEEDIPEIRVVHESSRSSDAPGVDLSTLHRYSVSFYALVDHVLLTLATRLPLAVRRHASSASLGDQIMKAFEIPPSPRVGELMRALQKSIQAGEIERGLNAEAYIEFLQANYARFDLPAS
jgi:hypothetical protein